jgi:UDP:flavonoid glycosyltransferase YjiC (YdhE family)
MKVLFVPFPQGNIAHYIPLLALSRMLHGSSVQAAFLLSPQMAELASHAGVEVLDIRHEGFRSELLAYGRYGPDVVVDDCSFQTTGFATALSRIPRITIQRTGYLPGAVPRNKTHRNSGGCSESELALLTRSMPDVTFMGLPQPSTFADLFRAEVSIIPSISSTEVLPPSVEDDPAYVFSGPLLLEDRLIHTFTARGLDLSKSRDFLSLETFFDSHAQRKRVYATFGTLARPPAALLECLKYLLSNDIAVVTSIKLDNLVKGSEHLYYYAPYLPMHFVCSNVDLMVHHCGSGTYQYPLLHEVPAITVGTMCYDRDDIAVRLAELGVSVHLPAPEEDPGFVGAFKAAIERYLDASGRLIEETKRRIGLLKEEMVRTSAAFDFATLLQSTVRTYASKASARQSAGEFSH